MTYIYSRKAYQDDEEFADIIESTASEANSLAHHMELIQEQYPDLQVVQLWTYEHSDMSIDTFKRCQWDSSADAFAVTDDMNELEQQLDQINEDLE